MSVQQKIIIGETFEGENILTSSRNAHLKAPKDSRGKGSHEKFRTVLFHECPPDTLESTNDQRGKAAEKTSIISVSTDFSSDIGSRSKLRSCHTPGRLLYPPHKLKKNNGECKTKCGSWFSK